MAGAETNSAGASMATGAAAADGAARPQFLVQRPAPGNIAVSEAPAGANLKFNFASTDAKVLVQDVDVIVAFTTDIDRRETVAALDYACLESAIQRGVAGGGRALGERLEGLEARVGRLAEAQSQGFDSLARFVAEAGAGPEKIAPALESTLSAGFDRLNHTMEAAFSAYSSLLHVVVATMEQSAASLSPEAPEAPPPAPAVEDALAEAFRKRVGKKL